MTKTPPSEQSIFLIASQIRTESERQAYLDQICGDNQELRSEVEALLAADCQSQDILAIAENVAATSALEHSPEVEGKFVGPYKLLEKIGEGGMGVVYMAEQREPVRRRVALKIIKPGMDTKLVIARFEAERQALAMMEHQNIARVFDAGTTENGRPYFAMELVKGVPITEFCDTNRLNPRQRLELFQHVCRAIHHSHQKGIIHRDIKPNNVLVCNYDGKPVPKVIDFGVAKATHQQLTEKTLFTQHGQVVGTLEYMSPEQAELSQIDIDTRSDIYSLGVLLYELLTGSTPITKDQIQSTAFLEVLRVICEEEPEKPSTRLTRSTDRLSKVSSDRGIEPRKLGAELRGELDWIIMQALEKDRTRRYETVNSLVADIDCYLNDEPVQACPPSTVYRLRKFARRYKTPLTSSALVLLLVFVALFFGRQYRNKGIVDIYTKLMINAAVQGQLSSALKYEKEANEHGAGVEWTHKITGIVELYENHGSSESAIKEFEKADQDDVAIKALLAIAYVWDGRWADHEKMLEQIQSLEPNSEDIEGHFFLGQALMWTNPKRGVFLLDHAANEWYDAPAVKMMLAEAYGHLAWATGDESHADKGIKLANEALQEMQENESARALSNWAYMVAASIRAARGKPFDDLLYETFENVEWLIDKPDYLIGYANRAWYSDLRGERNKSLDLWRKAVVEKRAGGWFVSCYAAEMYRQGSKNSKKALSVLDNVQFRQTDDDLDPDRQVARVFLLMDFDREGNAAAARKICESLQNVDESRYCATAQMMMRLRLGNLSGAQAIARRLAESSGEPSANDVISGSISAEELFNKPFESRRDELNARLLVAIYQMAQGQTDEAISTLAPALKMGGQMVVAQPAHWVRALYERPFKLEQTFD